MTKYDIGNDNNCNEWYSHHDCECNSFPKMMLSCGTGNGMLLPINNVGCCSQTNPLVVGSVSLDARGMKKAIVKIDFSSMISFKSDGDACNPASYFIRLSFRLSRVCENGAPVSLGSWNYEMSKEGLMMEPPMVMGDGMMRPVNVEVVSVSDSFAFTWCNCQDCPGCCDYMVEIIDIQTCNINFAAISTVGINGLAISGN